VQFLKCWRHWDRKKSSWSEALLQSSWLSPGPGDAAGVGGGGGDPGSAWSKPSAGVLMLGVGGPRGGRGCGIFIVVVFSVRSSPVKAPPLLSEKLRGR